MGAMEHHPGDLAAASAEPVHLSDRHRDLLKRAENQFRSSAMLLRATGASEHAIRAEHFAAWASLRLDAPQAAERLYTAVTSPARGVPAGLMIREILDCVLQLLHTDRGNIQLVDPKAGALIIAAQRGFDAEFLEYFAAVSDIGSACGRAAAGREQVMITDVTRDPEFAAHRDIAAASRFRAVQSTPLTGPRGRLVGVLSTHYPQPLQLPDLELMVLRRMGTLIGERLSTLRIAALPLPATRTSGGYAGAKTYSRPDWR
jgi:hypothetical protein